MEKVTKCKVINWIWIYLAITSSLCKAFSGPKYVWPLTDRYYSYDISTSKKGNDLQCGFGFSGSHPSFQGKPLTLDGFKYPYVDIHIGNENQFKSFAFGLFVNIVQYEGCLIHFKSVTSSSSYITDISVCFVDANTLAMTMISNTVFNVTVASVPLSGWNLLYFGRKYDLDSTSLYFYVLKHISTLSLAGKELGLPGVLRIGAKHDGNSTIQMSATCLSMFDVNTNNPFYPNDFLSLCPSSGGVSGLPTPSTGCACTGRHSVNNGQQHGSYTRLYTNAAFNDNKNKMGEINTNSPLLCASVCLEDPKCFSFTVLKINSSQFFCTKYATELPNNNMYLLHSTFYQLKCE